MSHKGGKDKTVQRSVIATFEPWPSHFSDLVKTEKATMEEAYDSLLIERTDLHHVKATCSSFINSVVYLTSHNCPKNMTSTNTQNTFS